MKKSNLQSFFKYSWVVLLAVSLFATSCKEDDEDIVDTETVIVEDGIYIKGAGTAFTELKVESLMKKAINEVDQAERATMYEMYLPVKAGADGFQIVMVEGGAEKTYGPGSDFAVVTPGDNEPTGAAFSRGTLEESSTAFTVAADGFYHVVLDTEYNKIIVAKVEWGAIGAAVPSGWTGSTPLTPSAFNLDAMTFTIENMAFTKGDFKFRYSEGWKIEIDVTDALADNHVKVNTNLGGSLDALIAGGDNIANDAPGYYTLELAWSKTSGYTATATKTSDLDMVDYSAFEVGLVGDGIMIDATTAHNWDSTIKTHVPSLSGTVYTWSWAGTITSTAGSFKIRQGQTWDELVVGYTQVTMAGGAAADFEANGDGNFVPKVDGTYNLTFTIDAATETYTLTAESAK